MKKLLASVGALLCALPGPAVAQNDGYTVRSGQDRFNGFFCDARNQRIVIRDTNGANGGSVLYGWMIHPAYLDPGGAVTYDIRFPIGYQSFVDAHNQVRDYHRHRDALALEGRFDVHVPMPADAMRVQQRFFDEAGSGRLPFWSESYPYPLFQNGEQVPLSPRIVASPSSPFYGRVQAAVNFCDARRPEDYTGLPQLTPFPRW